MGEAKRRKEAGNYPASTGESARQRLMREMVTEAEAMRAQQTEELTEELIAELADGGWPEQDVHDAAAKGARYHRGRHSLFFPYEAG